MGAWFLGSVAALGLGGPALGKEGAAFLRILPGARPMAMGGAYTAVADDLNSLGTNPSGLARLEARQAAFMHAELFAGNRYDFLGYAHPFRGGALLAGGTLGMGLQRLSYSRIEGRGADRQATGSFAAADTAVTLAYSRRLLARPELAGASLKYVESRLADASARTLALDLGLMRPYALKGRSLMLGVAARNLGPGLSYGGETADLPLSVSLGAGLRVAGAGMLSVDMGHRPRSGGLEFAVGSEYSLLPAFSLRAGYAAAPRAAPGSTQFNALGLGFGLRFLKASLDYSFSPYGELGSAQRLSLSSRF